MNSASLCSLAGRYDNPIPSRFLAPVDFLKIPAQVAYCGIERIRTFIEGSQGVGMRGREPKLQQSVLLPTYSRRNHGGRLEQSTVLFLYVEYKPYWVGHPTRA